MKQVVKEGTVRQRRAKAHARELVLRGSGRSLRRVAMCTPVDGPAALAGASPASKIPDDERSVVIDRCSIGSAHALDHVEGCHSLETAFSTEAASRLLSHVG